MDFLSEINVNEKGIALKEDIDKLENSKLNTTDAAASANKINTDAGSVTQPVYFKDGVPVKTTYTLAKSVPSDAVFTDTKYTHPSYTSRSSGLYKVTVDSTGHVSSVTAVAKSDITALGIPASDTDTHYTSKNVVNSSNTSTTNTESVLTNGNVYLISVENGAVTSAHKISGSGATTVTTDASGNIIISSSDTTYTSLKNPYALTLQGNGTTLTNGTYDGSAAKTVNITPSSIGAAASSHGTHVTFSTTVPAANGTAAVGTATTVSRSDHVHPLQTTVSGNAGTATKWATARNINGLSVDGSANRVNYGECSTEAATAAKVVSCTGFALVTGAEITVKFTVTNTASSPTLNVNSTGAKSIYYRGVAISAGYLAANRTYTFRYNGTQYDLVGDINTDTNTKVNVTLGTTTKAYLLGTSTTPTSTATGVTAISDTGVYLDTTAGKLTATTFAGALSGNASSATKWATARNINGLSVDGSANRVNYGTCSTEAATAAKTVACTGFALVTGAEITVKFTVTNTASSPTLNVNSTGAKAIYYRGSAISAGYLAANRTYTFRYNGTQYDLVGDIDTNTNTDTKNTTGASNTSSKIYLVGATSQSTNPVTYSHDTVFVDSNGIINSSSGIKFNSNGMYLDSWANLICGSSLYSGCSWHIDNSDDTSALTLYPHEDQKTLQIHNRTKFSYGARVYSGTLSSGSATVTITNLWDYTLLIAVAYSYGYLDSTSTSSTDHVSYTSFTIPIPVQYINGGNSYIARLPIDEHVYSNAIGSQIEISKSSTANSLSIKKKDDTTVKLGTWSIYAVI